MVEKIVADFSVFYVQFPYALFWTLEKHFYDFLDLPRLLLTFQLIGFIMLSIHSYESAYILLFVKDFLAEVSGIWILLTTGFITGPAWSASS